MVKDYITLLVGTLQRIHRQYIRYESALDDTLIRNRTFEFWLSDTPLLDPKSLAKYLKVIKG